MTGQGIAAAAYQIAVSSSGPNDDGAIQIKYSDMDCQAFVEHVLSECGMKKNWSGSNAMWRDMAWRGTPEECKKKYGKIPVGAWLFIWTDDMSSARGKYHADGLGNATHVGIYTALGKGAAHSSQSRGGVCQSSFRGKTIKNGGWNRIGLPAFVDFCIAGQPETVPTGGDRAMTASSAVVTAPSGSSVKLRAKPSDSCRTYWDVPIGTEVPVLDDLGGWKMVSYGGHVGYMMSTYLSSGVTDLHGDLIEISKTELLDIYDKLGKLLGISG